MKRHSSTYSSKEDDEDLLEKLEKVTSQRDILVEMILNGDKYSVLRTWAVFFNGGSHMPSSGGEGDRG